MAGRYTCKSDDKLSVKYTRSARIGNWLEESLATEEAIKKYAPLLKENKTLYQQHIKKLKKEIQTISITTSQPKLYSGDLIYIQNPHVEVPVSESELDEQGNTTGITLSLLFTPEHYEFTSKVTPGMLVTGTTHAIPTLRNTFKISKLGEKEDSKSVIYYGDNITFSPLDTYLDSKWYLECRPPNHFSGTLGRALKIQLRISPYFNQYCRWKIVNVDPFQRKTSVPVPANSDVIIQHAATNHTLCALENWTNLMFYKECEVTIELKESIFRRPLPSNVWQVCNSQQTEQWQKYLAYQARTKQPQ